MTMKNEYRELDLNTLALGSGCHDGIEQGACVMEAVSYIAREEWSDHPKCVSPVIAAFMRSWNDALQAEPRNRLLKPLIPELMNTATTEADEGRRVWMIIDWMIRDFTPPWLRLAKLDTEADALKSLAEIDSIERVESAGRAIAAARKKATAAGAAALAAAGDAARDAALAAAWDAALAAAGDAARAAARDAARDAAWNAAGDAALAAARAAAWAAARAALKPTKEALQQSAVELVKRLCAVGRDEKAGAK